MKEVPRHGKLALRMLAMVGSVGLAHLHAEDVAKPVPELANLKAVYLKEMAAAIQPVESRYRLQLEALVKTMTLRGDLAGANAVQAELRRITVAPAQFEPAYPKGFRLSNNPWTNKSGSSRLVFYIGEKFHENWDDKTYTGTWKALSDTEAVVQRSDGSKLTFRLDVDKQELTRENPREVFYPAK